MTSSKFWKIPRKFVRKSCDYATSSVKDYNKHLISAEHSRLTITYNNVLENSEDFREEGNNVYASRIFTF